MSSTKSAYGMYSLWEWERRLRAPERPGIRDLSDTRCTSGTSCLPTTRRVKSFEELIGVAAFLAVVNKDMTLLFREQTDDDPVLSCLLRKYWRPPGTPSEARIDLEALGKHCWAQLRNIDHAFLQILRRHGIPRWRHPEEHRYARWPIIQHDELWPIPMIDFSSSLRVAASFACGLNRSTEKGFLNIAAVPHLRSDLMTLRDYHPEELREGVLAIRLNSVRPPKAIRPR